MVTLRDLLELIREYENHSGYDPVIRLRPAQLERLTNGRFKVGHVLPVNTTLYGCYVILDEWCIPEICVEAAP